MLDLRAEETLKDLAIHRYDRVSPGDIEHLKKALEDNSPLCGKQYMAADMQMKQCDRKLHHRGRCEGDYITYSQIRSQL